MQKREYMFMKSAFDIVNPLRLANEDGWSCVFFSKREAYLHLFRFIYRNSSPVYAETEFLLTRLYGERYSKTHSIYMRYFQPLGLHCYEQLDPDIRKCKSFYRDFVRALHSYCETEFDTSQFDLAWNEFVVMVEKEIQKKYEKKLGT